MSAEVEVYMGRVQAWHGLGTILGRAFTLQDIIEQAPEIVLPVALVPTYVLAENVSGIFGLDRYIQTPLKGACVRSDGKVVGEGLGLETYGVIQPHDILEWGDAISGQSGFPIISAGTLREGRQFFFTYDAGTIYVGGLPIDTHLTVASSHDGTISAMALHSTTIVVCANTFAAAVSNASDRTTLKHTAHAEENLQAVIRAIKDNKQHTEDVVGQVEALMRIPLWGFQVENVLNDVMPPKFDKSDNETKASMRARSKVRGLMTSPVTEGFENTGWAFVQAVNTYEQWDKPVKGDRALRQFDSLVRGNQPLTNKAIERTLALV